MKGCATDALRGVNSSDEGSRAYPIVSPDPKMLRPADIGSHARLGLTQGEGKKGQDRAKGVGMRIYIETADDIDQVAARAKAAGVTLKTEPQATDWGSRSFEVTEPSGFSLTITSRPST